MACPRRLGGKNVQSLEKSRCSFLIIVVFQHILHSFWNYWWCLQFWLTLRQCNWICEFVNLLLLFFCGASGPKTWNFLLEINSTAIFCVVSIRSGIVEDVYALSLWQRVLRMLQETLSLLMTLRRYTVQFIVLHNSHSELCLVREKVLAHKPIFCVVFFLQLVKTKLQHDARVTILGHVQRGGIPSAFDRILVIVLVSVITRVWV